MKKVLALNVNGDLTFCTAPEWARGRGRCNHVAHQEEGEAYPDFLKRVEGLQQDLLLKNESKSVISGPGEERLVQAMFGESASEPFGQEAFIPYNGTEIATEPYRMTQEERAHLQKIENRMQLDMNIDGGYMELQEPLWNDMDKNWFAQISGMSAKDVTRVLHGDACIVKSEASKRWDGRVVSTELVEAWKSGKESYPVGWDPNAELSTGVVAMNALALERYGFEPTRYVYVLPYSMRMGIADHTRSWGSSASGDEWDAGSMDEDLDKDLDAISSDVTNAYKYLLYTRNKPDRQQVAYEALLNNTKLDKDRARYTGRYRNRSLADEFVGKGGVFRAVLSGNSVPYSGRAVITPNANLKFGECAIPASMAVDIFKPTLIQQLAAEGYDLEGMDAWFAQYRIPQQAIPKEAKEELAARISHKRVALCRQPSLHQSSMQTFRVRISDGPTIENNPLICKAYNADHDGDTMACFGFNQDWINPILDRNTDASLEVNTRIPRHQDTLAIMPTKDALFGLCTILERRKREGEE